MTGKHTKCDHCGLARLRHTGVNRWCPTGPLFGRFLHVVDDWPVQKPPQRQMRW